MTTLTISIIVVFVLGYALIATESLTKVNKAAIALLMLVGCWTLYMMDPMQYLQLMHPDYTGGANGGEGDRNHPGTSGRYRHNTLLPDGCNDHRGNR